MVQDRYTPKDTPFRSGTDIAHRPPALVTDKYVIDMTKPRAHFSKMRLRSSMLEL